MTLDNPLVMEPFGSLPPLRDGFARCFIVRHGQSVANAKRIIDKGVGGATDALTELGRTQESELGK